MAFETGGSNQTKKGIAVPSCYAPNEKHRQRLFPPDLPPSSWRNCGNDAYEKTWREDTQQMVVALRSVEKQKLIRSMGFCPHLRCQLDTVGNADFEGTCPIGLCYTKLEQGGLSYGACCFRRGVFESGGLIGFYNKTQPVPKPVYKHSRIVLGKPAAAAFAVKEEEKEKEEEEEEEALAPCSGDASPLLFVNANRVAQGLIATQCPLSGPLPPPSSSSSFSYDQHGFENTLDSVKKMIVEQHVKLWIALEPYDEHGDPTLGGRANNCRVFPFETFSVPSASPLGAGVSDFAVHQQPQQQQQQQTQQQKQQKHQDGGSGDGTSFVNMTYSLAAWQRIMQPNDTDHPCKDSSSSSSIRVESTFLRKAADLPANASANANTNTNANANANAAENEKIGKLRLVRAHVEHVWFHKWKDFEVPEEEQSQRDLLLLADKAVRVIRQGGSVAVSCISGRGRSGTFAALVQGRLKNVTTHAQLVDIIVSMRENRDGLVETPEQYRFVSRLLGLPDTSVCNIMPCKVLHAIDFISASTATQEFAFIVAFAFVVMTFVVSLLGRNRSGGGGGRRSKTRTKDEEEHVKHE